MRYQIKHVTEYCYESAVSECISEAHLTPRSFPGQTVISSEVSVEPTPRAMESRLDYFGNHVSVFSVLESHEKLMVTASSVVEVNRPKPDALPDISWEESVAVLEAQADDETLAASEYIFDSPFVAAAAPLVAYGAASLTPGARLADAAIHLSQRVHREFSYRPTATSIDMPLLDVLARRQGVCQDFAHVMIGVLRSYRLAARYVSGYLRSGADFQGAEASHAWVAVFLPGWGWLDLDPTNNVIPGDGHVTVAWGRDYGDVTPVKGVSLGGGTHTVNVRVRVDPLNDPPAIPATQPAQPAENRKG